MLLAAFQPADSIFVVFAVRVALIELHCYWPGCWPLVWSLM
jgi:hypothetical protein